MTDAQQNQSQEQTDAPVATDAGADGNIDSVASPRTFQISDDSYAFALDADGRLAQDVACITCNYNLRTTTPDSNCPECGKSVVDSLKGDHLQHAPLNWLKKVHAGMRRLLLSVVTTAIAVFAMSIFMVTTYSMMLSGAIWAVGMFLAWILATTGLWLVATPNPQRPDATRRERMARLLTRFSAIMLTLIVPLTFLEGPLARMFYPQSVLFPFFMTSLLIAFSCMLTPVALAVHLGWLCRRLPSVALALQFHVLTWVIGIGSLCLVLAILGVSWQIQQAVYPIAPAHTTQQQTTTLADGSTETVTTQYNPDGTVTTSTVVTSSTGNVVSNNIQTTGTPNPNTQSSQTSSSFSSMHVFAVFLFGVMSIVQLAMPIAMIWLFVLMIVVHRQLRRIVIERKAELSAVSAG